MKYRIKKETRGDGTSVYIPQEKVLFWWFSCFYPDGNGMVIKSDEETARDWIDSKIRKSNFNKVKKIEFIKK